MNKISQIASTSILAAVLAVSSFAAQAPGATAPAQPASTPASKAIKALPTAQEIADAKSKGLVWVNTKSKVYHTDSSSRYGATHHGQFMTKDAAEKAGYKAAKEPVAGKTKVTKAAAASSLVAK